MAHTPPLTPFSRYQKTLAILLAMLQFLVIMDLVLIAPLGAMIIPALNMSARQFGFVISAYAFSAGVSSLFIAGFADRFDRKKLLLCFYTGFIACTAGCGLATSFESLLLARAVTGLFAGVIGSMVLAIAADHFAVESRGRVIGFIQSAFSASQILGLPLGLYLANYGGWHVPFLVLATVGAAGGVVIHLTMRPVAGHLTVRQPPNAFRHLLTTLLTPRHWPACAAIALLTTGGYMLTPFSSAFTVNNLAIDISSLPLIYVVTGLSTILTGPLIGRASDTFGRLPVFYMGCIVTLVMVTTYTQLSDVSLTSAISVNVLLFVGIFSRLIPFQAMSASLPEPSHRGAFNAVSSAIQQLSGGCSSLVAGHIVVVGTDGRLQHFDVIGYILVATTFIAGYLVWRVQKNLLMS